MQFKLSENYKLELEKKDDEIRRLKEERKLRQVKLKLELAKHGHSNNSISVPESTDIPIKVNKKQNITKL